jgi:hypothetical protein
MICPQCKSEYRPGFDRCTDCDIPLVDTLPELLPEGEQEAEALTTAEGDDLVSVYHTADVALIPVLRSVLEGAGIPYTVQGEHAFGMEPSGGGWGRAILNWGVRFLVPRARADEAVRILAELDVDKNRDG